MLKKMFVGVAGLIAITTATITAAQAEYPEKPVEFIVPWSPGGGSDTLMRIVSGNIEPFLGEAVPIINMPGVSGTVGLKEASRRAPDGYTISQIHEGLLVANVTGLTDLNWDSFEPIALMTASPQFLVINGDRPYTTFEKFVTFAKENPGEIKFGVTLGGIPHLHAAMIEDAHGIQFSLVGYEGTGERIRALVGGNLDAAIGDISSSGQFVENGDLRFLAIGSPKRNAAVPDVPTFTELGSDLELMATRGIVMPKNAPEAERAKLESALGELAADAKFIEQINAAGAEVDFRGQEDYRAYLSNLGGTIDRVGEKLVQ